MTKTTRMAVAGLVAAALLLAACGSSDGGSSSSSTTSTPDALEITNVWARKSPMATTAGAVYLDITSPTDDKLLGASVPTDIAATTEVHETVAADDTSTTMGDMGDMGDMGGDPGAMTMRPVESIDLPAGETVKLEPGGYHIMLLDLVKPLEVGQTFDVTLTFEQAGEQTVTAEVREG